MQFQGFRHGQRTINISKSKLRSKSSSNSRDRATSFVLAEVTVHLHEKPDDDGDGCRGTVLTSMHVRIGRKWGRDPSKRNDYRPHGRNVDRQCPNGQTTVVLTGDTHTKDDKGPFGLDKEPEMIQSGLHPTADQVDANIRAIAANQQNIATHSVQLAAQKESIETNQQDIAGNKQQIEQNIKIATTKRFTALSDYDVKGQATVKFKVGSSMISPSDQAQLKHLAQTATVLTGYIVEVTGHADSTGSAAMNTKLSEDRAKTVVSFLMQQGGCASAAYRCAGRNG